MSPADLERRIAAFDWNGLGTTLDAEGWAVTPAFLDAATCRALSEAFDDDQRFRATIDMARHSFGRGRYRYFAYPLPGAVERLRGAFYPPLAAIANGWADRLRRAERWPAGLDGLLERCHAAGQRRPTPLLLRYGPDDFNCLHQDLYGEVHFPLQVIVMLSDPGHDFSGGELVLVEQRPRMQSRPMVVHVPQGAAAVIPVRERPRRGSRGDHRVQLRHGVSRVTAGQRTTLGLIFHDAR